MKQLLEELGLYFAPHAHCIALTGSGGKTTAMVALANHYAQKGKRVLLSTTTKLLLPRDCEYGCDTYFLDDRALSYHPCQGERVFYAHRTYKAVAPPLKNIEALLDRYDVLLLEADGSRGKGLKLHLDCDPVVPPFVTATLAILSLSLLGEPFGENCFGSEHYRSEFPEESISLDLYRKLLEHGEGVLKRAQGKTLVLCNQSSEQDVESYRKLCSLVSLLSPIWFGDIRQDQLIHRNPS
ncbi:MAG: selenium cofactor biosynthesis protein YqeC [Sphaerochaeta sp.]|nr:selenium cofactor biosynthesis protein YqeC [Sphaerochaeta sp.]